MQDLGQKAHMLSEILEAMQQEEAAKCGALADVRSLHQALDQAQVHLRCLAFALRPLHVVVGSSCWVQFMPGLCTQCRNWDIPIAIPSSDVIPTFHNLPCQLPSSDNWLRPVIGSNQGLIPTCLTDCWSDRSTFGVSISQEGDSHLSFCVQKSHIISALVDVQPDLRRTMVYRDHFDGFDFNATQQVLFGRDDSPQDERIPARS